MHRRLTSALCLCALAVLPALAQDSSEKFYQAIRNNDLSSLRSLLKGADVNIRDTHESTPLMYAAAYGSLDAMKLLVDAGADVNARNAFNATALLWCVTDMAKVRLLAGKGANVNARSKQGRTPLLVAAATDGASAIVQLLVEKGADLSARDEFQSTPLLEAVNANDTATIRFLLQKGADVNARAMAGDTPLILAAGSGNLEVIQLLLAKGADVNTADAAEVQRVKNGPIALGNFTPLLYAAAYGGADAARILLDAGAKVNAQDVRGMTPLMLAIATDRPDVRLIRMLLDKGADRNIKSKNGESAIDWARKFNDSAVLEALGIAKQAAAPVAIPAAESKSANPREAAEKGLALLQRTSGSFFNTGGCVSCHAQNMTALAVSVARARGLHVDEAAAAEQLKTVRLQWTAFEQVLLQRMDPPGAQDTIMYSVLNFAAAGAAPDHAIDAMVHNLAGEQRRDGRWHFGGISRPPMEDGDFSRTALCIRALAHYGPPGRKTEFDQRIQRASTWLKTATPRTTEDRNMQLLGLKWAKADRRAMERPLKELVALQRPDGGWSQTPNLASDAYATGVTLYTMHELGIPASDPAYRRGVAFLLAAQLPDGSWHVASRAPKFQPYFQSGFPHDHDQWISASATAWASIALAQAAPEKPAVAALR